ncbi:hypothetical protein CROQUDRAFT_241624 [Cronartium quercuum f. sp. fusiforme G11]|uniref:Uncharacterized protein n=1 Tax=Cronartium quercuum f. sp. fusiforme G11 TaxID=708437 RepID=A0A9P6NAY6_9BASI|nr:hypothetical protein CROQUDRAFT_241624 [Cronartium quercuum f. sp. fusiforme G11]
MRFLKKKAKRICVRDLSPQNWNFLEQHGKQIAVSYIQVPLATVVLLFFAYLVDLLIALLPFTFPSSVSD